MNISRMRMAAMATLASLLGSSAATAHPGHGVPGDSDSLWHQLSTPYHLMVCIILAAVAWTVAQSREACPANPQKMRVDSPERRPSRPGQTLLAGWRHAINSRFACQQMNSSRRIYVASHYRPPTSVRMGNALPTHLNPGTGTNSQKSRRALPHERDLKTLVRTHQGQERHRRLLVLRSEDAVRRVPIALDGDPVVGRNPVELFGGDIGDEIAPGSDRDDFPDQLAGHATFSRDSGATPDILRDSSGTSNRFARGLLWANFATGLAGTLRCRSRNEGNHHATVTLPPAARGKSRPRFP